MLDYPYSGSIAVPSAPFKVSTLVLLSGDGHQKVA
jgi:hypothetical protein